MNLCFEFDDFRKLKLFSDDFCKRNLDYYKVFIKICFYI